MYTHRTTVIRKGGLHISGWWGRNPRAGNGVTAVGHSRFHTEFALGRIVGKVAK
jgi:hypothetical protein